MGDMPKKPPRGIKQNKEPSNLLMSVIRTLSTSQSDQQREEERARLELEFKKSDKKLDELVSKHEPELHYVINVFAKLSQEITSSRQKLKKAKSHLEECKTLLRCRRDEINKLWLDGVEHKYALNILDQIGELRGVSAKIGDDISKKDYKKATENLTTALNSCGVSLKRFEALTGVCAELNSKRQQLHNLLLEELHRLLYLTPFRRTGSQGPLGRQHGLRGSNRALRYRLKISEICKENPDVDYEDELDENERKQRDEHQLLICLECLGKLQKLPDAIESVRSEMSSQLSMVIDKVTLNSGGLLQELTLAVVEIVRKIAENHSTLLKILNRKLALAGPAPRLYDIRLVWQNIQEVLKDWLSAYLNVLDSKLGPVVTKSSNFSAPNDISIYFSRKKLQKPKKTHLFRFDSTITTINYSHQISNHVHFKHSKERSLVCPATINNIKTIYGPVRELFEDIEQITGNRPCELHIFLNNVIQDEYLKGLHLKLWHKIEAATRAPHAWQMATTAEDTSRLNLPKPLLKSTIVVDETLKELKSLFSVLPDFGGQIVLAIRQLLDNYREICQAAYRGIVQPESEDKRVFSSAWLKDEDINRFIKSLPNWSALQAHKPTHQRGGRSGQTIKREETQDEESPEDVRVRNEKEAMMLASNIGENGVRRHEILADVDQLKKLALLHESMEWLSAQILKIPDEVNAMRKLFKSQLPEEAIGNLFQLVHEFTELADICLLVLHLEVRVQCFHYLHTIQSHDAQGAVLYEEPEPKVIELCRVLSSIHDALNGSLQSRKLKYVFEGLAHVVANILITSTARLSRIDEAFVERMCRNIAALQHTLAGITASRELALDHATQYFELFFMTPNELLAGIVEHGPIFRDIDYLNAIQLLHKSNPRFGPAEPDLVRLSDILGETGVTV